MDSRHADILHSEYVCYSFKQHTLWKTAFYQFRQTKLPQFSALQIFLTSPIISDHLACRLGLMGVGDYYKSFVIIKKLHAPSISINFLLNSSVIPGKNKTPLLGVYIKYKIIHPCAKHDYYSRIDFISSLLLKASKHNLYLYPDINFQSS